MERDERLARLRAYSALVVTRGDPEAALGLSQEPAVTTDWARIFQWKTESGKHGVVIDVQDVQSAWPISVVPPDDADLDRFVAEYRQLYERSFDPTTSPRVPSRALELLAQVLGSRTTAFLVGIFTIVAISGVMHSIWSHVPTWMNVVAGVAAALVANFAVAGLDVMADRHLGRVLRQELVRGHFAHLPKPLERRYIQCAEMFGVDDEVTQFWADQLVHVRTVLARNKFDDLNGKLADTIVQFVEAQFETPSDPASSSTIADQRRHEQP
ncbi:hypothetical protein K7711_40450 [Nocardia sp. CA2R105]|uniref:hypothetical protein n=1 Tax=Nocardia coffeae TaxID=2873381 RepID=UPI001CA6E736|nr:hypothetical protein [Nocardia coffeae]MBY8862797.1 hypothetical protein [Nocardia coffeae]